MHENNCVILTPNECDRIGKKKLKLKFQTTEQGGELKTVMLKTRSG